MRLLLAIALLVSACSSATSASDGGSSACPAPFVSCGGVCTDTRYDPAHCGACGTACPAGAWCAAGSCTGAGGSTDGGSTGSDGGVLTLWSGSHCNLGSLAQDATALYWGNGSGLYRIGKDGSGLRTLESEEADGVVVGPDALVWTDDTPPAPWIRKANLDGSSPGTVVALGDGGVPIIGGLAVAGHTVYFTGAGSLAGVYAIQTDGSGLTELATPAAGEVAASPGSLFFSAYEGLVSIDLDGGSPQTLFSQPDPIFAFDDQFVYASTGSVGGGIPGIYRMSFDGTNPVLLSAGNANALTAASGNLYWAAGAAIYRIGRDGSGLGLLATAGQPGVRSLLADANGVYWLAMDGLCNGVLQTVRF